MVVQPLSVQDESRPFLPILYASAAHAMLVLRAARLCLLVVEHSSRVDPHE
jgi:hypothetical protein